MEIQEEKVMWIRKIGLGILIGVVLCSVMVNAEERNSRKAEPMTVMERMREIPHKIYGKKKSRNKMRKVPGNFKLQNKYIYKLNDKKIRIFRTCNYKRKNIL